MSKPSAIQREFNVIIVLNNEKEDTIQKKPEQVQQIREIEMVNLKHEPTYTLEGQIVTGGGVEDIKSKLKKGEHNFFIKDRINETDNDIFETIFEYIKKTLFCRVSLGYLYGAIDESDFVIFISNGISDSVYEPMCIAFIQIYKKKNDKNFLYISTFCANEKFGQCGTFLMDTIKYIATLLNCDEIRLESLDYKNTRDFYNRNKFERISFYPVEYNHFYKIEPNDAIFKPPPVIEGNASISGDSNPDTMKTEGGKYTKKSRTKKSRTKRKI